MALLDDHIDGKYEILEKLREGGMGAIYKVRHRLLDEIRVVKVIRSAVAGHADAGERFLREARAAIRLRHPNIAALHDFAIGDDGNAFIVMELIDGSTFQEILDRHGRPPLSLTLEMARQSLRALGYLHRQRIVHRDVAPDNLMLTRDVDGHALVKVIDLGIAKAFEEAASSLTSTGVFLGKPRYASPEQFGGMGLDVRSDLYSFGVVLYELLTGRSPIQGSDPSSYMAGHLLRPPIGFAESDPEGRVPEPLRAAVLRSLAKQPEERFADAEEFAWALTLIQDDLEPLPPSELAALLRPRPVEDEVVPFPARPGSTQGRLDREFLLTELPDGAETIHPRGGPTLESAATRRLVMPEGQSAEPTRPLPLRVVPPPAAAPPPAEPSVLDDMTWVTTPTRVAAPPPAVPVTPPAPPIAGAQVARGAGWGLRLLGLGGVLLLAAAGGLLWMRPQRPAPAPSSVSPAAPTEPAEASVAPQGQASQPASPPEGSAAPGVQKLPETEELRVAAAVPPPAVTAPGTPKKPLVEDAAPVTTDLAPMQAGALILRGQPNVETPVPLDIPAYGYPAAARGSGRQAKVKVRMLVDENGRVTEVSIRDADGSAFGFDEAALAAARAVVFQPATRDGIPGKMWTEMIFEFSE